MIPDDQGVIFKYLFFFTQPLKIPITFFLGSHMYIINVLTLIHQCSRRKCPN